MSRNRIFACLIFCLGLIILVAGCVGSQPLKDRTQVAVATAPLDPCKPNGDKAVAIGGEIKGGPFTPTTQALQLSIQQNEDREASRTTTAITEPQATGLAPNTGPLTEEQIKARVPKKTPRGGKANLAPAPVPCPPAQAPRIIVVDERTWFPKYLPLGGAGATFEGYLIGWVRSLLSNVPNVFAGAFIPAPRINMQQGQASTNTNINKNHNTNINPIDINNTAIGTGIGTGIGIGGGGH